MSKSRSIFITLVILSVLLVGCTPAEIAASPTFTFTPRPTQENSRTLKPLATAKPSQIANTQRTKTSTPTEESFEFLYSLQEFQDWIGQIEDCEPPCVWGITPGETTVDELRQILSPFGVIKEFEGSDGITSYSFYIPETYENDTIDRIGATFFATDIVVDQINIVPRLLRPNFDSNISNLLVEWGTPSEIWTQVNLNTQLEIPNYDMTLIFYDVPVVIWIESNDLVSSETGYAMCPQIIQGQFVVGPVVIFWDASRIKDINALTDMKIVGYSRLTEVNPRFDNETFWEAYKDPDASECIDIAEGIK